MTSTSTILTSVTAMHDWAGQFAHQLRTGECVALYGTVGAGKTECVRALVQALLGDGSMVSSPTFTLANLYEKDDNPKEGLRIWHHDWYRIEDAQELEALGIEEALEGILLVEWPEVGRHLLPHDTWHLTIEPLNDESRRILLERA